MCPFRDSGDTEGGMREILVHVCTTCKREGADTPVQDDAAPRPGALMMQALATEPTVAGVAFVGVECLGNCSRGCSVALSSPGCWTYVFGDLTPGQAPEVITAARLFQTTENALMPWRGRPDAFKKGMVARIPPLPVPTTRTSTPADDGVLCPDRSGPSETTLSSFPS